MSEITGGELLLRSLHAENVRHITAITDGTYMIFLEALERLGEALCMHLVVPRHEAAGGHIADAYSRVTGEPAVVMACAGPGAANLLAGVICAQAENSPVVAITTMRRSDVSDDYRHMGGTQSPSHLELFKPATKWNGRVSHWRHIPDMVRHAFRVANSGMPGPVHLLILEDVLMQTGDPAQAPIWPRERTRAFEKAGADPQHIKKAAALLAEASMANIHAGNGAVRAGAGKEILALAELLQAPITNNASARGVFREDHDLYYSPVCPAAYMAHAQADVILAVGSRLGELAMWGRPPLWGDPAEQPTIQIERDPANIGLNRPVDVALIGDARVIMGQLLEAVKELSGQKEKDPRLSVLEEFRANWQKDLDNQVENTEREPMLNGQIVATTNGYFGDNAILVLDGGNTVLTAQHYIKPQQEESILYTANFGHLGTGLPYAIGAKLAAPERPVYCISGDSAFGFNMQELETAARLNLPITVIVAVDGAYGMEKTAQQRVFNRQAPWFHHDHAPVRYDLVAEAMGCHGEYVTRAADLPAAITRGQESGKPVVIHAVVDPEANVDPPGLYLWNMARSGKVG